MKIDPTKALLLIIDMQADFYAEGGNAAMRGKSVAQMQALPAKIENFAARLRPLGAKVVYTRFISNPALNPKNYIEIISQTKASNWMCQAGTPGAEFAGASPTMNDMVLDKYSYDCFADTVLLALCKKWEIDTIIITGVRTEVCVTHTAVRSFAEGFRTIIARDLVGTYDDKTEEAATILSILGYSSYLMSSDEIVENFQRAR